VVETGVGGLPSSSEKAEEILIKVKVEILY